MSKSREPIDWCCVVAVNDPMILEENLAASPALVAQPNRLEALYDQPSASIAYNLGLKNTNAEIVVFAHQDVYLPEGWEKVLADRIRNLDSLDPKWAIAGLIGLTPENTIVGHVWCSALGLELGAKFKKPKSIICIDELLIILKRSSNLSFDSALPSFHLYGTDIVNSALKFGYGAYVIHAPVVHNTRPVVTLKGGYTDAYLYMQKKWIREIPIPTLIVDIDCDKIALQKKEIYLSRTKMRRRLSRLWRILHTDWRWSLGLPPAQTIARRLGFERVVKGGSGHLNR